MKWECSFQWNINEAVVLNYNSGFRSGAKPKWAVTTVNRILTNELYTGTMVQGKNRKTTIK